MSNGPAISVDAFGGSVVVTYVPSTSLKPDPRNARTHSLKQVEQIAASIRDFGVANPILATPEGNVIAGHDPLRAAGELGW